MEKYNFIYKKLIRFLKENDLYSKCIMDEIYSYLYQRNYINYRLFFNAFSPTATNHVLSLKETKNFMDYIQDDFLKLVSFTLTESGYTFNDTLLKKNYQNRTLLWFIDRVTENEKIYENLYNNILKISNIKKCESKIIIKNGN